MSKKLTLPFTSIDFNVDCKNVTFYFLQPYPLYFQDCYARCYDGHVLLPQDVVGSHVLLPSETGHGILLSSSSFPRRSRFHLTKKPFNEADSAKKCAARMLRNRSISRHEGSESKRCFSPGMRISWRLRKYRKCTRLSWYGNEVFPIIIHRAIPANVDGCARKKREEKKTDDAARVSVIKIKKSFRCSYNFLFFGVKNVRKKAFHRVVLAIS